MKINYAIFGLNPRILGYHRSVVWTAFRLMTELIRVSFTISKLSDRKTIGLLTTGL